ncbi:MAG: LysR family transcriptional regulator [Fusobacteriota bacterium]
MDLHYLKIFYEVAREGSFTNAAKKLFINQSAVSIQVKKFENNLNVKLFDRSSKKIKLTYAGEVLFKKAKIIFREIDIAKHEIKKIVTGKQGKIVIGATHMIGEPLLPEIIDKFSKLHPTIEYEIYIKERDVLLKDLKDGEVDLVLMGEYFIKSEDYEIIPVMEYPFIVVYNHEIKDINELDEIPLIGRDDSLLLDKNLKFLKDEYGVSGNKHIIVNGSIETVKNLVIEGLGFTILPYYCVYKEILSGEMKVLHDFENKKNTNGYQVVKLSDKSQKEETEQFINFIKEFEIEIDSK